MIRKSFLAMCILIVSFVAGCMGTWNYASIADYKVTTAAAPADKCKICHAEAYRSWGLNAHADGKTMERIPHETLRQCGACHDLLDKHIASPEVTTPVSIPSMSKSEQNRLCGKCHFDKLLMNNKAINPGARHGVFMSVGYDKDNYKRQIACLDCHSGHATKGEMLNSIKAHVCFSCHKEAIVTMGIFQPFNYLAFGKACQACHTVHGGPTWSQAARLGIGTAAIAAVGCLPCHV
jgi:predicted CXXCH cytochrome family protein